MERLSQRQRDMLSTLATDGPAPSKMQLVRRLYTGRGHAASYATIERLERRGLISTRGSEGVALRVEITDRGRAAIA